MTSRNQRLQGINDFKESVGCVGNKESREKESGSRGRDAENASSSLAVSILFCCLLLMVERRVGYSTIARL